MKLERSKNAKRNILVGVVDKVVCIILPFLVRTIIIKRVGEEYLGLNSLFSSILQVLSVSELGFSTAIVYSMYKPIAENDSDTICALLNFYRKAYNIIGIVIAVLGVSLLPWLDRLISGRPPEGVNIYILYLLYLSNTVISYLMFAYRSSILQAYQRTDVTNAVHMITQVGTYIMQMIVLLSCKNYYLYVAALPLFTIVNNLLNLWVVRRNYPQFSCRGKVDKSILNKIKHQVAGLMVSKICQTTRTSFDNIFIAAFIGLTASAIYSNYMYIMNAVIMILSVISKSIVAGVGNSIVTESVEKNYNDLKTLNFIYMWISGWCTVCLLCLYQPFMEIWVGEDLMASNTVTILFCLYFYALKMGDMRSVYSEAAGIWWEMRYRAIAEAVCNLILNFMFVRVWGLEGIILGTFLSLVFINFALGSQIVFQSYFKNGKLKSFFIDHMRYLCVTAVISSVTYFLVLKLPGEGLWGFILKLVICTIIPNALYLLVYHRTKDFKVAAALVERLLPEGIMQRLEGVLHGKK